jgi:hypothetical protein
MEFLTDHHGLKLVTFVGSTETSKEHLHLNDIQRTQHFPHHMPLDRTLCVASRRDVLVERRPRNADRLGDFVNCMFLLKVQIDGDGTLLLLAPLPFREGNVEAVVEANAGLPGDGECPMGKRE